MARQNVIYVNASCALDNPLGIVVPGTPNRANGIWGSCFLTKSQLSISQKRGVIITVSFDAIRPSLLCHRHGQITLKKYLTRLLPLHLPTDYYCYFILLLVHIWYIRSDSLADFLSPFFYQLLMNNFCIDRCVGILLHLRLLNLPQSWPDLSNTGVCLNNLV